MYNRLRLNDAQDELYYIDSDGELYDGVPLQAMTFPRLSSTSRYTALDSAADNSDSDSSEIFTTTPTTLATSKDRCRSGTIAIIGDDKTRMEGCGRRQPTVVVGGKGRSMTSDTRINQRAGDSCQARDDSRALNKEVLVSF